MLPLLLGSQWLIVAHSGSQWLILITVQVSEAPSRGWARGRGRTSNGNHCLVTKGWSMVDLSLCFSETSIPRNTALGHRVCPCNGQQGEISNDQLRGRGVYTVNNQSYTQALLPSTFGVMEPLLFVGAESAQEKEITDTDSCCWCCCC